MLMVVAIFVIRSWLNILFRRLRLGGPFNDLIEFTPVKPHPPALGAIVYFNTLAIRHYQ